jgi:hypothetical protein
MPIVVNEDLKAYIDPLTPDEHAALERSLLTEGCRDALVLWGDVLVDGHNRYGICQQHGIPFQTLQSTHFKNLADVHLWMIDQHLGRRSVSDFQRGVLALRKREILGERRQHAMAAATAHSDASAAEPGSAAAPSAPTEALASREDIAKAARLSSSQVGMIERIQKQATPELVAAVKSGILSINAAAAVATLPEQEQVSAALGGKEELQQAAKRVRETRKRTKPVDADAPEGPESVSVAALQLRITELETENAALRAQLATLMA